MKSSWTVEELVQYFTLQADEREFLGLNDPHNHPGKAVQTRTGGSYSYHYRQILPPLLEVLEFRSNNERHRPLIDALEAVKMYLEDEYRTFYPMDALVPIQDVISPVLLQSSQLLPPVHPGGNFAAEVCAIF